MTIRHDPNPNAAESVVETRTVQQPQPNDLNPNTAESMVEKTPYVWVFDHQMPSVFGRNLQCKPVRGANFREACHRSHAWQRFKRSKGVKLNGILECNFLSENAHRTELHPGVFDSRLLDETR
jgi:hypothetical protein